MNIIELAKQANGEPAWNGMEWLWEELQKFANLVAAKEREACAEIADEYANGLERNYSEIIAHNIRARGEQS